MNIKYALFALPSLAILAACGPTQPEAPAIPPTELYAVKTPPPAYPVELGCKGIGGTATLLITIGPGKNPGNITLAQSSGNAQLDAAAQDAVKKWEFKPATRNGQPVPTRINVPVSFNPPVERPAECFKYDSQH